MDSKNKLKPKSALHYQQTKLHLEYLLCHNNHYLKDGRKIQEDILLRIYSYSPRYHLHILLYKLKLSYQHGEDCNRFYKSMKDLDKTQLDKLIHICESKDLYIDSMYKKMNKVLC